MFFLTQGTQRALETQAEREERKAKKCGAAVGLIIVDCCGTTRRGFSLIVFFHAANCLVWDKFFSIYAASNFSLYLPHFLCNNTAYATVIKPSGGAEKG